jgi:hypothetical protein
MMSNAYPFTKIALQSNRDLCNVEQDVLSPGAGEQPSPTLAVNTSPTTGIPIAVVHALQPGQPGSSP